MADKEYEQWFKQYSDNGYFEGAHEQYMNPNYGSMPYWSTFAGSDLDRVGGSELEYLMSLGVQKEPSLTPAHVQRLIKYSNFKPEAFQFDHWISNPNGRGAVPIFKLIPLERK